MEESKKKVFSAKEAFILLTSVSIVGFCTIIYELLIGSISSYFLGDSVKQFSIVIGITMTSMGLGTLLSRLVKKNLVYCFIVVEIILAIVGGFSAPALYFAYLVESVYYPVMIFFILVIGTLIGLEIPLLTRIMEKYYDLRDNISNVLSLDYLGSFAATLLFPFVFLPFLGIFDSSVLAGGLNLAVGVVNFFWFKDKITKKRKVKLAVVSCLIALSLFACFALSKDISRLWENIAFSDKVIFSKQTPYQKVVVTKNKADFRMFIDGNVQFSSIDEYRYHELLVHIPMLSAPVCENVLLLGGGDGLAAREILKYSRVKNITVVDLDKEITDFAQKNKLMTELNKDSFNNPKVHIVNDDAYKFVENADTYYDVIIIDLPDPNNTSLARLYSKEFYSNVKRKLSKTGVIVTQATSPFFSCEAYWCIKETLTASGFKHTYPYHTYVPSFGDWGFVMASDIPCNPSLAKTKIPLRFLDNEVMRNSFKLENDIIRTGVEYSTLNNPKILDYYLSGWKYWN